MTLTAAHDPPCPECGCRQAPVVQETEAWGRRFVVRQCGACGHRFQAGEAPASRPGPGQDPGDQTVTWTLPRCPRCHAAATVATSTVSKGPPLVQRRRCKRCGRAFRSRGE